MKTEKVIFLTGLLSARVGGLEIGNLGNFAIIDPFIDNLKLEFPDHKIRTSFQLSEPYETAKGIVCLRDDRFWNYGFYTAKETIRDVFRLIKFKMYSLINKNKAVSGLKKSKLLSEIWNAEFVIDFSGDVFGENAKYNVFLEGAAKMYFSYALNKKVFILASSPGPFKKLYKKIILKYLYPKAETILNREPLSTDLLHSLGLSKELVKTSACPSYLFKGYDPEVTKHLIKKFDFKEEKALVGFIITGWNMPIAPYNKLPREESELTIFVEYLAFLYHSIDANILLMSHANATSEDGQMCLGNDYYILKQLYAMLPDNHKHRIKLMDDVLDARTSKSLIANFDMLISGRLHGAIAGISQCIPTMVIDYGHEPKAHKILGFLKLLGVERFLTDPNDLDTMKTVSLQLWNNREAIKSELREKVGIIQERSLLNFKSIKNFL